MHQLCRPQRGGFICSAEAGEGLNIKEAIREDMTVAFCGRTLMRPEVFVRSTREGFCS
jgi:hypothetical protein